MKRSKLKHQYVRVMQDTIMKYPVNLYLAFKYGKGNKLGEEVENELLDILAETKDKKKIKAFLRFLYPKGATNRYITTYFINKKKDVVRKGWGRRSLSDLVGIYVTYFPEENNEEGILNFIREYKKFAMENGIIGHYCNEPEKVVFLQLNTSYNTFIKSRYDDIPLSKFSFELNEKGYYEDEENGKIDVTDGRWSHAIVDDDELPDDGLSTNKMRALLREV